MTTKAWLDEPTLAQARDRVVFEGLGGVSGVGALVHILFASTSLVTSDGVTTFVTHVILAGLWASIFVARSTHKLSPRNAHLAVATGIIASSFSFLAQTQADPTATGSLGVFILLVAAGLLTLSWGPFWVTSIGVIAVWTYAGFTPGNALVDPLLELAFPGIALGFLIHRSRMRSHSEMFALHLAERERTRSLDESHAQWRSLVNNLPGVITIVDRSGKIQSVQSRSPIPPTVPGRMLSEYVSEEDHAHLNEYLNAVFEEQREVTFEMQARTSTGEIRWFAVSAGPILADTTVSGALLVSGDITDRKREDAAVRQAEKLSSLGTLVAGVAHEINNPLTYIRGNLELNALDLEAVLDGTSVETAHDVIHRVLENQGPVIQGIDRIEHITQSLKRVAKARQGQKKPEDVNGLIESVLAVAQSKLPATCRVEKLLAATRQAHIESSEVTQVVLNLVFNAIDAVRDRPSPQIKITTSDEPHGIVLSISDNGPGIQPAVRPHIFTPFKTTKPNGTGLGLSISHRIAEEHGGSLSFETGSDGTTFTLRLPHAPPTDTDTTRGSVTPSVRRAKTLAT